MIQTAEEWVQECIRGNKQGYRVLYDRYADAMYNTALRIVCNETDAEDILQESFIDAFTHLADFQGLSSFGAWLKKIVVYKSIGFLKQKDIPVSVEEIDDLPEEEVVDEAQIVYTIQLIRSVLVALPPGYRTIVSLYMFEGYDHEEIAEILHISPVTARTQYFRGKQKLVMLVKQKMAYEK
jgi:RNA polymerase sigma factor (sigma-70 family)